LEDNKERKKVMEEIFFWGGGRGRGERWRGGEARKSRRGSGKYI